MNTIDGRRKGATPWQIAVYAALAIAIAAEAGPHVEVMIQPATPIPNATVVATGSTTASDGNSGWPGGGTGRPFTSNINMV
jgi:hypothetical protein